MNRRVTLILIGLIAVVILPLIIWLITSLSQQGTIEISVTTAPQDVKIEINNHTYQGVKSMRLAPGEYTATISKDGFETDTQKISVKEGGVNHIIASLLPVSDEAKQWYKDNQSTVLRVEGKAGEVAAQKGEAFVKKYPITEWLPLQKATYTIGYKQVSDNSDDGIIITIDAVEGFREAALQQIRDKGIDPADYTIEFINYRNPFNE